MNNNNKNCPNTYLALGDSYTIGEGVIKTHSFPQLLTAGLNQKNLYFEEPLVIAKTGFTTRELLEEIDSSNIKDKFKLVTLLIGVNNQYRNYSLSEYQEEFKILLHKALAFADDKTNRVFVFSIPDWSVTPFAREKNIDVSKVADEIDQFNAVNKKETESLNIRYFDITSITRKLAFYNHFLSDDGLHYAKNMHQAWVDGSVQSIYQLLISQD